MRIYTHSYELKPFLRPNSRTSLENRRGVLVAVEDQAGTRGYADLHPWPELGDPRLEDILSTKSGNLWQAALANAQSDLHIWQQNQNLLAEAETLKNHYWCSSPEDKGRESVLQALAQAQSEGYQVAKLKCGKNPSLELKFLEDSLGVFKGQWRLDMNASMSLTEARAFFGSCSQALKERIEFVEDPCPFSEGGWRELSATLPLACDFEGAERSGLQKYPFKFRILKPSRMQPQEVQTWMETKEISIVMTTSMGHGLDILFSMATILKFPHLKKQTHGLQAFDMYERDFVSRHFIRQGPHILGISSDAGFEFRSELERLSWTLL